MNKKELVSFKNQLKELQDELEKNINSAKEEINLIRQQSPTDEGDHAVLMNDASIDDKLIVKQTAKLKEIREALDKISNGNYGICEMCEEPISLERLKVKPYAKYCISCREINEKESVDN